MAIPRNPYRRATKRALTQIERKAKKVRAGIRVVRRRVIPPMLKLAKEVRPYVKVTKSVIGAWVVRQVVPSKPRKVIRKAMDFVAAAPERLVRIDRTLCEAEEVIATILDHDLLRR